MVSELQKQLAAVRQRSATLEGTEKAAVNAQIKKVSLFGHKALTNQTENRELLRDGALRAAVKLMSHLTDAVAESLVDLIANSKSRDFMAKDEWNQVSKTIDTALCQLGALAFSQDGRRILEFLVEQYAIQKTHLERLFCLYLPIHETHIFVKFAAVVAGKQAKSSQENAHPFALLFERVSRSGVGLSRRSLLSRCRQDPSLILLILKGLTEIIASSSDGGESPYLLFLQGFVDEVFVSCHGSSPILGSPMKHEIFLRRVGEFICRFLNPRRLLEGTDWSTHPERLARVRCVLLRGMAALTMAQNVSRDWAREIWKDLWQITAEIKESYGAHLDEFLTSFALWVNAASGNSDKMVNIEELIDTEETSHLLFKDDHTPTDLLVAVLTKISPYASMEVSNVDYNNLPKSYRSLLSQIFMAYLRHLISRPDGVTQNPVFLHELIRLLSGLSGARHRSSPLREIGAFWCEAVAEKRELVDVMTAQALTLVFNEDPEGTIRDLLEGSSCIVANKVANVSSEVSTNCSGNEEMMGRSKKEFCQFGLTRLLSSTKENHAESISGVLHILLNESKTYSHGLLSEAQQTLWFDQLMSAIKSQTGEGPQSNPKLWQMITSLISSMSDSVLLSVLEPPERWVPLGCSEALKLLNARWLKSVIYPLWRQHGRNLMTVLAAMPTWAAAGTGRALNGDLRKALRAMIMRDSTTTSLTSGILRASMTVLQSEMDCKFSGALIGVIALVEHLDVSFDVDSNLTRNCELTFKEFVESSISSEEDYVADICWFMYLTIDGIGAEMKLPQTFAGRYLSAYKKICGTRISVDLSLVEAVLEKSMLLTSDDDIGAASIRVALKRTDNVTFLKSLLVLVAEIPLRHEELLISGKTADDQIDLNSIAKSLERVRREVSIWTKKHNMDEDLVIFVVCCKMLLFDTWRQVEISNHSSDGLAKLHAVFDKIDECAIAIEENLSTYAELMIELRNLRIPSSAHMSLLSSVTSVIMKNRLMTSRVRKGVANALQHHLAGNDLCLLYCMYQSIQNNERQSVDRQFVIILLNLVDSNPLPLQLPDKRILTDLINQVFASFNKLMPESLECDFMETSIRLLIKYSSLQMDKKCYKLFSNASCIPPLKAMADVEPVRFRRLLTALIAQSEIGRMILGSIFDDETRFGKFVKSHEENAWTNFTAPVLLELVSTLSKAKLEILLKVLASRISKQSYLESFFVGLADRLDSSHGLHEFLFPVLRVLFGSCYVKSTDNDNETRSIEARLEDALKLWTFMFGFAGEEMRHSLVSELNSLLDVSELGEALLHSKVAGRLVELCRLLSAPETESLLKKFTKVICIQHCTARVSDTTRSHLCDTSPTPSIFAYSCVNDIVGSIPFTDLEKAVWDPHGCLAQQRREGLVTLCAMSVSAGLNHDELDALPYTLFQYIETWLDLRIGKPSEHIVSTHIRMIDFGASSITSLCEKHGENGVSAATYKILSALMSIVRERVFQGSNAVDERLIELAYCVSLMCKVACEKVGLPSFVPLGDSADHLLTNSDNVMFSNFLETIVALQVSVRDRLAMVTATSKTCRRHMGYLDDLCQSTIDIVIQGLLVQNGLLGFGLTLSVCGSTPSLQRARILLIDDLSNKLVSLWQPQDFKRICPLPSTKVEKLMNSGLTSKMEKSRSVAVASLCQAVRHGFAKFEDEVGAENHLASLKLAALATVSIHDVWTRTDLSARFLSPHLREVICHFTELCENGGWFMNCSKILLRIFDLLTIVLTGSYSKSVACIGSAGFKFLSICLQKGMVQSSSIFKSFMMCLAANCIALPSFSVAIRFELERSFIINDPTDLFNELCSTNMMGALQDGDFWCKIRTALEESYVGVEESMVDRQTRLAARQMFTMACRVAEGAPLRSAADVSTRITNLASAIPFVRLIAWSLIPILKNACASTGGTHYEFVIKAAMKRVKDWASSSPIRDRYFKFLSCCLVTLSPTTELISEVTFQNIVLSSLRGLGQQSESLMSSPFYSLTDDDVETAIRDASSPRELETEDTLSLLKIQTSSASETLKVNEKPFRSFLRLWCLRQTHSSLRSFLEAYFNKNRDIYPLTFAKRQTDVLGTKSRMDEKVDSSEAANFANGRVACLLVLEMARSVKDLGVMSTLDIFVRDLTQMLKQSSDSVLRSLLTDGDDSSSPTKKRKVESRARLQINFGHAEWFNLGVSSMAALTTCFVSLDDVSADLFKIIDLQVFMSLVDIAIDMCDICACLPRVPCLSEFHKVYAARSTEVELKIASHWVLIWRSLIVALVRVVVSNGEALSLTLSKLAQKMLSTRNPCVLVALIRALFQCWVTVGVGLLPVVSETEQIIAKLANNLDEEIRSLIVLLKATIDKFSSSTPLL